MKNEKKTGKNGKNRKSRNPKRQQKREQLQEKLNLNTERTITQEPALDISSIVTTEPKTEAQCLQAFHEKDAQPTAGHPDLPQRQITTRK